MDEAMTFSVELLMSLICFVVSVHPPAAVCWHKSFMKWHFSNTRPVNQSRQEEGGGEEDFYKDVSPPISVCPPGAVRLHPWRHLGGVSLWRHRNSSQSAAVGLLWDEPIGSPDKLQSDQRGVQGNVLIRVLVLMLVVMLCYANVISSGSSVLPLTFALIPILIIMDIDLLRLWTWWHQRCGWRTAASLCCLETTKRTAAWTCCLQTAACRSSSLSMERAPTTSTLLWWTYVTHTT